MTAEKRMLVAFLLNAVFAVAEYIGGLLIGSVAIASDAVHDFGDALSIGFAWVMERRSKKAADAKYTYGYVRYSVLGSAITGIVLLVGSVLVIVGAVERLIHPTAIAYDEMIVFAVVGVVVNFLAMRMTHKGESLNQKAVTLHLLEDVLGWVVVLVGAVVMRFTDAVWLDAVLSIGVAVFVLYHVALHLKEAAEIILGKVPKGLAVEELTAELEAIDGVRSVHHLHVWSMDGHRHVATLHADADEAAKAAIRQRLAHYNVVHVTVETGAVPPACCFAKATGEDVHCHLHGGH